ncbi:MAG: Zn-dependent alcohol dehydrogenase [Pseudomonadales bacterium]|nr:Zn-dependent alcohol dehydrogenase [Pseudomonadales bacterium]
MKSAVLSGPGPLTIEEVTLDGPGAGEVLVKIAACGVCHSDLHVINGVRAAGQAATPVILGHEAAGVVEEIGPGVTSVVPGDHVIMAFHPTCGKCYYCRRAMPQICETPDYPDRAVDGAHPRLRVAGKTPARQGIGVGGFSEYTCMPEGGVVKIRKDAPLETVCLIGCAVTTGIGAVTNAAKVEPGSLVAVIGLGGVGLNCVQGARLAGAHRIIAIDVLPDKLEMAARFGATDFINASAEEDVVRKVVELTQGRLDYAFEAIGLGKTVEQAFAMIRPGGTAVAVGVTAQNVTVPGRAFLAEKKLIGSLYGSASIHYMIPRLVDLYMEDKIMLDELVSKRRPLSEINEAFADLEAGHVARSVLYPGQ